MRRKTSDSCSRTSFRCKYLQEDQADGFILFEILLIAHLVSILLRATERIHIPWLVILLPELLIGIFAMLFFIQVFVYIVKERRERLE